MFRQFQTGVDNSKQKHQILSFTLPSEEKYFPLAYEHKACWIYLNELKESRSWGSWQNPFPTTGGDRESGTYLSTRVRITASVSSTSPSTFCFFLLGSCGPQPLLGGWTGSQGWVLKSAVGTALFSACCWLVSTLSSAPLSSRQIQELPMVEVAPLVPSRWAKCSSRANSRPWPRLLLAKNTAQPKTII